MKELIISENSSICFCFIINLKKEETLFNYLVELKGMEIADLLELDFKHEEEIELDNKLKKIEDGIIEISHKLKTLSKYMKDIKIDVELEKPTTIERSTDHLDLEINYIKLNSSDIKERIEMLNQKENKSDGDLNEIESLKYYLDCIKNNEIIIFLVHEISNNSEISLEKLKEEFNEIPEELQKLFKIIKETQKKEIFTTMCMVYRLSPKKYDFKEVLQNPTKSTNFSNNFISIIGNPTITGFSLDFLRSPINLETISWKETIDNLVLNVKVKYFEEKITIENIIEKYKNVIQYFIDERKKLDE